MRTVGDVIRFLDEFAPANLAEAWDNVGLLLGERAAPGARVLTCLTLSPDVAGEAIREGVQLIVTHHPILFRPVQRLTTDTPEGRTILELARHGVAVYSPHTAFDNTRGGVNDLLARRLGLEGVEPLRPGAGAGQCKVAVFVPDKDLARVSDALFAAGAGRIGHYRECSFRLPGTGTFLGTEAANPTVGQKGRREEVSEWRLEVVCPEESVRAVVAALRKAHSYEEPAFDVYPLRPTQSGGSGRVGNLPAAVALGTLARAACAALQVPALQRVGDENAPVRRVAVACGAAGEFLADARRAGADAFLTGEMRFHDCLAARTRGPALLLPGHYATERLGVEALAEAIQRQDPALTVWASRVERDPLHWHAAG